MRNNPISNNHPSWNIFEITDETGRVIFNIGFNPLFNMIEFTTLQTNKSIITLDWKVPELFDESWHKVRFGVYQARNLTHDYECRDDLSIVLYVDCRLIDHSEKVENVCLTDIDVDGNIKISSDTKMKETIPIDIQHMVIMCDPERISFEVCE